MEQVVPLVLLELKGDFLIDEIKEISEKILSDYNLKLYSVKIKSDYGVDNIIEIIINKDEIESKVQEEIHLKILDEINDIMPDDSYLEISSRGLEYKLETIDDIKNNIGCYIYIVSDYYKGYCILSDFNDDILEIEYKIKNKVKKINIKYVKTIKIRKAVRI